MDVLYVNSIRKAYLKLINLFLFFSSYAPLFSQKKIQGLGQSLAAVNTSRLLAADGPGGDGAFWLSPRDAVDQVHDPEGPFFIL